MTQFPAPNQADRPMRTRIINVGNESLQQHIFPFYYDYVLPNTPGSILVHKQHHSPCLGFGTQFVHDSVEILRIKQAL